jgi:hypothetical protein
MYFRNVIFTVKSGLRFYRNCPFTLISYKVTQTAVTISAPTIKYTQTVIAPNVIANKAVSIAPPVITGTFSANVPTIIANKSVIVSTPAFTYSFAINAPTIIANKSVIILSETIQLSQTFYEPAIIFPAVLESNLFAFDYQYIEPSLTASCLVSTGIIENTFYLAEPQVNFGCNLQLEPWETQFEILQATLLINTLIMPDDIFFIFDLHLPTEIIPAVIDAWIVEYISYYEVPSVSVGLLIDTPAIEYEHILLAPAVITDYSVVNLVANSIENILFLDPPDVVVSMICDCSNAISWENIFLEPNVTGEKSVTVEVDTINVATEFSSPTIIIGLGVIIFAEEIQYEKTLIEPDLICGCVVEIQECIETQFDFSPAIIIIFCVCESELIEFSCNVNDPVLSCGVKLDSTLMQNAFEMFSPDLCFDSLVISDTISTNFELLNPSILFPANIIFETIQYNGEVNVPEVLVNVDNVLENYIEFYMNVLRLAKIDKIERRFSKIEPVIMIKSVGRTQSNLKSPEKPKIKFKSNI